MSKNERRSEYISLRDDETLLMMQRPNGTWTVLSYPEDKGKFFVNSFFTKNQGIIRTSSPDSCRSRGLSRFLCLGRNLFDIPPLLCLDCVSHIVSCCGLGHSLLSRTQWFVILMFLSLLFRLFRL